MFIWKKYLLSNYLKILLLSTTSFILLLIVCRLEAIAQFASFGTPLSYLCFFILYQIPCILPMVIPLACLLASLLVFKKLSNDNELTALRASGFSLKKIISPLCFISIILSFINFYITSELATKYHLATKEMLYTFTAENPLLVLKKSNIANASHVQMDLVNRNTAKDLFIALRQNEKLHFVVAKKITVQDESIEGKNITIISSSKAGEKDNGSLIIENQEVLETSATDFANIANKKNLRITDDHLKLKHLLMRKDRLKIKNNLNRCYSEMVRRFSLGLSVFTFSLMGAAFGMEIRRHKKQINIVYLMLLTALTLVAFFAGKGFGHIFWLSSTLFLSPHIIIIALSCIFLSRIRRGLQ